MAKMNQFRPHHSRCQDPNVKLTESVYENVTVSYCYGYCPYFTEGFTNKIVACKFIKLFGISVQNE